MKSFRSIKLFSRATGRALIPASAAVLCLLSACVAELEPEVGGVRAGLCQPRDTDPDTDVSFSRDIQPLLERPRAGCGCHITNEVFRAFAIDASGLELTSYADLMRGGDVGGDMNVIPGDPCNSVIVQKISPAPPFGERMPSSGPPFWTPEERTLLSDWIAEGAYDN